ncbi:MAG: dienelactone hydrolase family protein [Phycisphaerales bacterium]|nr:dienelactone hydrolase family protein [Phycisphaerales bacterium]
MHTTLLMSVVLLCAPTALAQATAAPPVAVPDANGVPAAKAIAIPPDAEGATKALVDSPRHGEWVDIALPTAADGSKATIRTWVSYPERSDQAPVVLVVHEIFGMTDWVRAVADQLAAEGFIAVAPDLL